MTSNSNILMPARKPPASRSTGGRFITWVNGKPIPTYSDPLNKQQMSDLLTAMLSTEYQGELDPQTGEPCNVDTRFMGMTHAEVMAFRLVEKAAQGHDKSITEILDRILGKPKQSVESVGVRMDYRDYLNELSRNENGPHASEMDVHTVVAETIDLYADDEEEPVEDWL